MKEKISIIVPIYKVEQYLSRCVESLLRQTYAFLEIILVDDGSPDKSGIIAEELKKKDDRIKVIHKKNGGLSDARNAGINAATGDYLMFVDSDDFIADNMVELLLKAIHNTGADISICSFYWIKEEQISDYINIKHELGNIATYSGKDKWNLLYDNNLEMVIAVNKLYKREVFRNIRYKKGILHEDEEIIHKVIDNTNVLARIDAKLYYYIINPNSIVSNYSVKRFVSMMKTYNQRRLFFKGKGYKDLEYRTARIWLLYIIDHIEEVYPSQMGYINVLMLRLKCLHLLMDKNFRKYLGTVGMRDPVVVKHEYAAVMKLVLGKFYLPKRYE